MAEGLLIVISGPSGVGKGSIIETVMKSMPNLTFSVSCTTRKPRENEKEGVHYFFISEAEFKRKIDQNEFLEWARVHNDYYGTLKGAVRAVLSKGQDLLLDIDVQGGQELRKGIPEAVSVFILPPTLSSLKERLQHRHTENTTAIEQRLHAARKELSHITEYQYVVVNDSLLEAVEDVKAIIRAERCKSKRRLNEISHALSPD